MFYLSFTISHQFIYIYAYLKALQVCWFKLNNRSAKLRAKKINKLHLIATIKTYFYRIISAL